MKHSTLSFISDWREPSAEEHELIEERFKSFKDNDNIISAVITATLGLWVTIMIANKGLSSNSIRTVVLLCTIATSVGVITAFSTLTFAYRFFKYLSAEHCVTNRRYKVVQVKFDDSEMDNNTDADIAPILVNSDGTENKDFRLVDLNIKDLIACKRGSRGYLVQTFKDVRLIALS